MALLRRVKMEEIMWTEEGRLTRIVFLRMLLRPSGMFLHFFSACCGFLSTSLILLLCLLLHLFYFFPPPSPSSSGASRQPRRKCPSSAGCTAPSASARPACGARPARRRSAPCAGDKWPTTICGKCRPQSLATAVLTAAILAQAGRKQTTRAAPASPRSSTPTRRV